MYALLANNSTFSLVCNMNLLGHLRWKKNENTLQRRESKNGWKK